MTVRGLLENLFPAAEVLEMGEDLENGKAVVERGEGAAPKVAHEGVRAPRAGRAQGSEDLCAALVVVAARLADPFAMALEGFAVAGEEAIDFERPDPFEGGEEFAEGIAPRKPADVGSDGFENMVAGEQRPVIAAVKAEVARRVARSEDEFEGSGGGVENLAAFIDAIGDEFLKIRADAVKGSLDAGDEGWGNAGGVENMIEPNRLFTAAGDAQKLIEFVAVEGEFRAGEGEEAPGLADVVGMGVGEEDFPDGAPGDVEGIELRP